MLFTLKFFLKCGEAKCITGPHLIRGGGGRGPLAPLWRTPWSIHDNIKFKLLNWPELKGLYNQLNKWVHFSQIRAVNEIGDILVLVLLVSTNSHWVSAIELWVTLELWKRLHPYWIYYTQKWFPIKWPKMPCFYGS